MFKHFKSLGLLKSWKKCEKFYKNESFPRDTVKVIVFSTIFFHKFLWKQMEN